MGLLLSIAWWGLLAIALRLAIALWLAIASICHTLGSIAPTLLLAISTIHGLLLLAITWLLPITAGRGLAIACLPALAVNGRGLAIRVILSSICLLAGCLATSYGVEACTYGREWVLSFRAWLLWWTLFLTL